MWLWGEIPSQLCCYSYCSAPEIISILKYCLILPNTKWKQALLEYFFSKDISFFLFNHKKNFSIMLSSFHNPSLLKCNYVSAVSDWPPASVSVSLQPSCWAVSSLSGRSTATWRWTVSTLEERLSSPASQATSCRAPACSPAAMPAPPIGVARNHTA